VKPEPQESIMAAMKRTTMYSKGGKKLYAVRAGDGTFKDIQTYQRAQAADMRQTSAAEAATARKAATRKKAAVKKSPAKKAPARKAPAKKAPAKKVPAKKGPARKAARRK
jgi:topoisomerase IA-like protein